MSMPFDPLNRLLFAVFGKAQEYKLQPRVMQYHPPVEPTGNAHVVMDGVAITADEGIGISLIDGGMYGHVVVCREDGQLSYFKSGDDSVTVITRQQLVDLINEQQNQP